MFRMCLHKTVATLFMALLATVFFTSRVPAVEVGGYIGVDGRAFIEDPAFTDQSKDPAFSLIAEPELRHSSENAAHQFKLTPFARLESVDDERSHVDLREAYWRYSWNDSWFLIGANKVFWGVTESQHLVDIINQSDNLEDIDLEEKLGQPMILLGTGGDLGDIELYIMPYFRERQYPGDSGRLRFALPVSDDAEYESGAEEFHTDFALRYAQFFGDWDVGASYFYGTSREPLFKLSQDGSQLVPFYGIIHQWGLDIQYTREAWLWKFEGIVRDGLEDVYGAAVGGFEYTLYQIFGSNADLGLLLEYNWDDRDEQKEPLTLFDNDLFVGSRFALNDTQDTTALVGVLIDTENDSTILSLEAERRLGQSWVVELIGRFFLNTDETDATQPLAEDSYVNLSLKYYF